MKNLNFLLHANALTGDLKVGDGDGDYNDNDHEIVAPSNVRATTRSGR